VAEPLIGPPDPVIADSYRLDGRVAVISGGAGGAGAAIARLFATRGAFVEILDTQDELGRSTASDIGADGGRAGFTHADVSKAADVETSIAAVLERHGRVDVLVNHAGTVIVRAFHETTEDEWDRLMAINVKSMFLVTRAVLPAMLGAGRGTIVNTASISSFTASPLESAYCVTKGAVLQLTRAIAVEYRDRGIRCNAVCPGFIKTPHGLREMAELSALGVESSEAAVAVAQGRICEPEEVARVVLFLASDASSFVNGEGIVVDNASTVLT